MKLLSSLFALFGAISLVSASLNCTVKAGTTVDYKACEYSSCADVGQYKGGDLIMAACRSDCSSDTAVWFKLYPIGGQSYFADAVNMTGCNYHGTNLAMTVLPYCYQESNIAKPTTCTATPVPTGPGPTGVPPVITTTPPQPTGNPGGCSVQKYGQCGGQGYSGCKVCASGSTCKASNQWYSQCL